MDLKLKRLMITIHLSHGYGGKKLHLFSCYYNKDVFFVDLYF